MKNKLIIFLLIIILLLWSLAYGCPYNASYAFYELWHNDGRQSQQFLTYTAIDVYLSKTLAPPSGKIGHQSTTIKPQHKISSSIWVQVKLNRYHHINICHIGLLSKTVFCFSKYKSTNVVQSSPYLNHIIMTNTPTRTKVVRED